MNVSDILTTWYQDNKRDLPWRKVHDPYLIWISEIILQQTRIAQGMDYYLRFVERFPDIYSLAEAPEDEVLRYWQGLGYYSRARNLHEAARTLAKQFGGKFPTEYEAIRSLKGIGDYTAAAITSLAWDLPYPVVDGNVFRVLSRLFALDTPIDTGKGKKIYTELAASIMPKSDTGLHNQAIMEFGALQCVPQNPDCKHCPLQAQCLGYATGTPQAYPVKQNKTKTRNRYFHYLNIIYKSKTWLNRRSGKDIWKGLYEFPLIETVSPADFADLQQTEAFHHLLSDAGELQISLEISNLKHVLTHQTLYASFYKVEINEPIASLQQYIEVPIDSLDRYAVPRLIQLYLEKTGEK
ncbi:A/G-specific adenine glycosylase [Bacteroidia bacterium]|nr:A/G-specific adenine glycosylase [Bacteroidia bacterium]